jgi:hypothetical protein
VNLARSAGKPRSDGPPVIYAFDVAPARLGTALITERGVLQADCDMLANAFPERTKNCCGPPLAGPVVSLWTSSDRRQDALAYQIGFVLPKNGFSIRRLYCLFKTPTVGRALQEA